MDKREDNLVAWIAARYPQDGVPIGIGDDMAMLPACPGGVLAACDMVMDGVDFDTREHSPEQIGRKALAVNLSDCAAMAVRPRWALVSLALPGAWTMQQAQGLYLGMELLAQKHGVRIVGGDTNSWNGKLAVDVTVLAEPWDGIPPVKRDGMQAGDVICVTGRLGGSLARHHLDFEPRVNEARNLARFLGPSLHAMMDLSDGLSTDAWRMERASLRALQFDEAALISTASEAAVTAAGQDGRSVLSHVLDDGEDFELLFAVDGGMGTMAQVMEIERQAGVRVTRIGRVAAGAGVWLNTEDGRLATIERRGWEHFRES